MKTIILFIIILLAFFLVAAKSENRYEERISMLCERIEDLETALAKQGYQPRTKFKLMRCR